MAFINSKILTDHVYERIKDMIAEGLIAPGERINRKKLGEELGVSQTPVNEALSRLLGEQFLGTESRKGYFVREYSCAELVDLLAARAAIEGMAARLACMYAETGSLVSLRDFFVDFTVPITGADIRRYSHVDIEFHRRIVGLSENHMIIDMFDRVGYVMKCNLQGMIRPPDETLQEHRAIVESMVARDYHSAAHLLTEHVMRSRATLDSGCEKNR